MADSAVAYPEGAPWGAAAPDADQTCASCHFGDQPVRSSAAIMLHGLPEQPETGKTYALELVFAPQNGAVAGFQLIVDGDAGAMISGLQTTEASAGMLRSSQPSRLNGVTAWRMRWQAPEELVLPIVIYIACVAGNEDDSPFGDIVHYRQFTITGGEFMF